MRNKCDFPKKLDRFCEPKDNHELAKSLHGALRPINQNSAACMKKPSVVVALLLFTVQSAFAQVWQVPTGSSSWGTAANWNPATVPNSVGATATFNNAASANNPAQTGNRTANLDGAKTVGSIVFNADAANAFTNTIATGTGGPLTFDAAGAGPATLISN